LWEASKNLNMKNKDLTFFLFLVSFQEGENVYHELGRICIVERAKRQR
jgi:hypothetical protein